MAICSVTPRALEHGKQVKQRGWYLDILEIYKYIETKDYQYSATPSLPHMFALNYQLDRILAEGLEQRYARHKEMAEYTRAWAKKNFALYPEEKYASVTLTTITNTRNISVKALNDALGKMGMQISKRLRRSEREDLPHRAHGRANNDGRKGSHRRHRKDSADTG